MKIIARIKELPEFAVVTKPTGAKQYQLHRKLNIFQGQGVDAKVVTGEDVYFLLPRDMSINGIMAVSGEYEVSWLTTKREAVKWLEQQIAEEECDNK
ncbi:hypothetical protein E2P64_08340 [Candidatus Bathyarchaeota archaeon]|nr:hypothetical protein E2P64_08340 [Candidatus Bathyarchaeota archaeon]